MEAREASKAAIRGTLDQLKQFLSSQRSRPG